jgi:pimeloyl-ACP methyl ester carboxylesterase
MNLEEHAAKPLLYTGARPQRVAAVVLMEGAGPPAMHSELAVTRTRSWLDALAQPKPRRTLVDVEDALRRLRAHHARVPSETLRSMVPKLTCEVAGALYWAHDPLHLSTAPVPFNVDSYKAFAAQVTCPLLFVSGGAAGWHPPDEAERLAAFGRPAKLVELSEAGHMMHWTQPEAVAHTIAAFVAEALPDPAADIEPRQPRPPRAAPA